MQIQCPKCQAWIDSEDDTCSACNAILRDPSGNENEDGSLNKADIVPKQSAEDAVKEFLVERRKVRIKKTIQIVCFLLAALGTVVGYLVIPIFSIPAIIFFMIGFYISQQEHSHH